MRSRFLLSATFFLSIFAVLVGVWTSRGWATNLLVNGGAESGTLTGWVDPIGHGFNIGTAANPAVHPPFEGSYTFWAGVTGPNGAWNNEIRQDVDVSGLAVSIDAGNLSAMFAGEGRTGGDATNSDYARILIEYRSVGGAILASYDSGNIVPINTWVHVSDSRSIPAGTRTIRMRLTGVRAGGQSTDALFDALSLVIAGPTAVQESPADGARLLQNHPNPFNPSTTISYTLAAPGRAVLDIFDASGAVVTRLDQGVQPAGTHSTTWNGRDAGGRSVASGVYFYRLEGMPADGARKMVLLK